MIYLFFKNKELVGDPGEPQEKIKNGQIDDEEMENDPLQHFMKKLDKEMSEKPPVIPKKQEYSTRNDRSHSIPERKPIQEYVSVQDRQRLQSTIKNRKLESNIDSRRLQNSIEERHLTSQLVKKNKIIREKREALSKLEALEEPPRLGNPRILKVMGHLPHLQNMIIYQAILDKPKGLKPFDEWW